MLFSLDLYIANMYSSVKQTTIAALCSELGFNGSYPGRNEKSLTYHTLAFPIDSLLKQEKLHPSSDSPEAQRLAVEFCSEDHRGQTLWPDNTHQGWPTWRSESSKYVK